MTLLHAAVDAELDSHGQTGKPLGVSATAYLLARGADPKRKSHAGRGLSAEHVAFVHGHWLATALFDAWQPLHAVTPSAGAENDPRGEHTNSC